MLLLYKVHKKEYLMPQSKEVHREYMAKRREGSQKLKEGSQTVPPLGNLPERPRYLTLSDGQVLDRANPPKGKVNEYDLNGYKSLIQEGTEGEYGLILSLANPIRRKKLQLITDSLKKHSMLDNVRYGIWGPTFKSIDKLLNS